MMLFNQAPQMVCDCRRGTGGQMVYHYNLPKLYTSVTCSSIPMKRTSRTTSVLWERSRVSRSSTMLGGSRRGKLFIRGYLLLLLTL